MSNIISFSKKTQDEFDALVSGANLVENRIYFVTGASGEDGAVYIALSTSTYQRYVPDLNLLSGQFNGKVDKVTGQTNEVPVFNAEGNLTSSDKTIGTDTFTGLSSVIPTEKAVETFVTEAISNVTAGTDYALTGATFDANADDGVIDYTFTRVSGEDAIEGSIAINGLVSGVTYSGGVITTAIRNGAAIPTDIANLISGITYQSGKLSIGIDGHAPKEVNLPVEQFLHSAKKVTLTQSYIENGIEDFFGTEDVPASTFTGQAEGTQGIIFQLAVENNETAGIDDYNYIFIPLAEIITDYTFDTSVSAPLEFGFNRTGNDVTLTGALNYNETELTVNASNELEILAVPSAKVTGLDTLINGKIDKVFNEAGEIAKFKSDGNVESTNYSIGVSAAYDSNGILLTGTNEFGQANKVATEEAIVDLLTFK